MHVFFVCKLHYAALRRYNEAYVDRYRATTIKDIIRVASEKDDQARFPDDDDIEVLLATEELKVQEDEVKV